MSGSPAIMKVTSAARPSRFSAAKRWSMRVVICGNARWGRSSGKVPWRRSRISAMRMLMVPSMISTSMPTQYEPFLAGRSAGPRSNRRALKNQSR